MKKETFSEKIDREIAPFINFPKGSKESKLLAKRIASLFGERLSDDHLPIGPVSEKRTYLGDIFNKYSEIKKSFERIGLAKTFISKIPKNKSVSKVNYIGYHYEYYLNEIYILKTRVNLLLNFLIKKCQKAKLVDEINEINGVKEKINKAMKNILERRGMHVHKKRYENDKYNQISILDSLNNGFDDIHKYKDFEIKKLQKNLIKEISGNIMGLDVIVENYIYQKLGNIIFDKLLPTTP